jgi:Bacterial SH3 domain
MKLESGAPHLKRTIVQERIFIIMQLRRWFLPVILPLLALFALTACIRPVNPQGTPIAPTVAAPTVEPATATPTPTAEPATATPTPTAEPATATSTATAEPPTATPTATAEPATATPVPAPTEIRDDEIEAAIKTIFAASVGLTTTQPTTQVFGLEGVRVFVVNNPLNQERLFVAHTVGIRSFDPLQHHVLALYRWQAEQTREIARLLLDGDTRNPPQFAPDYVGENSVSQVEIEPTHLWIEIQGGVGAHSGVYGLYRFDGTAFTEQVNGFSASPGAGEVRDLNGDGVGEVLLNVSDAYVFCYACGVRYVHYEVNRWNGEKMELLTLATLPAAEGEIAELNNTLVDLAQRGLWRDALAGLEENSPLPPDNETLAWNAAYIRLNAEVKRAAIPDSPYPLLNELFYGDLAAAVDHLRDAGADAIFIPDSPLIQDTPAVGWEAQMGDYILRTVEPQLSDESYGAEAHFLTGWAYYLKGDNASARTAVQQAVTLAPDDTLFAKSLDFLEPGEALAQVTALANVNVRSGPGTSNPIIGRLLAGTVAQITGRTADGAELWWQIVYPAGSDQRGWVTGDPQFTSATGTEGVLVVE